MGVSSEQMWGFDKEQQMQFLAEHGKSISRMIAVTMCRRLVDAAAAGGANGMDCTQMYDTGIYAGVHAAICDAAWD